MNSIGNTGSVEEICNSEEKCNIQRVIRRKYITNFIHPPWALKFYCSDFCGLSSEADKEKPV